MIDKNTFSSKIALLLFAHSEKKECFSKPLAKTKRQNVLLWKKMNKRVLNTIQKTNLFYFHSNETNQIGTTFGKKLTNAIQNLFEKGFEKVIVIGNDCPELQSAHFAEAISKLAKNDVVLGSNYNGGTYLMGISQTVFDATKFAKIHWQTPKVVDELITLFENNSLSTLEPLQDCNTINDLKKIISKLSFLDGLKFIISAILFANSTFTFQRKSFYPLVCYNLNFNKGSPVLLPS